ncbi:MAG: translation elongation factor Ts [Burkholderiaceae bacterium]|jgi:elongation factor Ts
MAEITASMVKELREKTDAPMMECKKALAEAEGDMVKAEEILRVKLGNKAGKAASRIAAEGIATTYISADGKSGALIEVNCETDFVAKNDDFIAFTKALAQLVVEKNPANVEALSALPLNGSTVDEVRKGLIGKIGENMSIRRFARMQTANRLASYTHGARIGVLVDYAAADEQVGKDVAMHIAASKPVCVSKDQVPAEKIEVERNIYTQQAAESGKPADIVAKMVEGRITKFLAEITLLSQPFVKNPDETVEKMLKAKSASVAGFALYVVGEGIEKKQDDFASEVAKIAAGMQ